MSIRRQNHEKMENQTLRTTFLLVIAAGFYALLVAFTTQASKNQSSTIDNTIERYNDSSIEHWVTRRLGYPGMLQQSLGHVVVKVQLQVDSNGVVKVLSCNAHLPELETYIKNRLDGEIAHLSHEGFAKAYEIKINFRRE